MISKIAGIVLSPFAGLKGDPLRGLQAIDILAISNQLYISKHTSIVKWKITSSEN